MRFISYFEPDFLIKEQIIIKNVECCEEKKTFKVFFRQ